MGGDHFYCLDPRGELAPSGGYQREGITGYVYNSQQPNTVPIFRWWNPKTGDHFYTRDPNGELAKPHYNFEGIGWYMFPTQQRDTVPLYRWYNQSSGDHFYTTDPSGELAPASGYIAEGVTGYLYLFEGTPQTQPLFRWYQSGIFANFTFTANITDAQKKTLLERHSWAYYRGSLCPNLTDDEKRNLAAAYRQAIRHDISTDSTVNASAQLNRPFLWINFNNLFPLGDDEVAQTLIHEMMHVAGYTHPKRRDPPLPNPDVPGDGGVYFGTTPLKAEMCIAGKQSDAATVPLMLAPNPNAETRACPVTSDGA
jgi:hypothetical protein